MLILIIAASFLVYLAVKEIRFWMEVSALRRQRRALASGVRIARKSYELEMDPAMREQKQDHYLTLEGRSRRADNLLANLRRAYTEYEVELNRVKKLDNLDYYQTMLQEIDEL